MISRFIDLKNFKSLNKNNATKKSLKKILFEKDTLIKSFSNDYKNNYSLKKIKKYKKFSNIKVIGMGGSSLGIQAIYNFFKSRIKKKFNFIDTLRPLIKTYDEKNNLNLIISKSGDTIETIVNTNIHVKKNDKNIFIVDDKNSYLKSLAYTLKSEIIHHNNFIGGRFSVLSEVGMLPAELMGLRSSNFRQLNSIIKNKKFLNSLISNVNSILFFIKNEKFNSIVLNYDEKSTCLFNWYQQLVAESLGKKKGGILPIISNMPKDNHSVMQLYLDGFKKNFFTFFYVHEKKCTKINNSKIYSPKNFLKEKDLGQIIYAQKKATENIFKKKNIPFRSFEIYKRDEKTLGELFSFFMLETILLGRALKVNPFNQPAVDLIKKETKKILI